MTLSSSSTIRTRAGASTDRIESDPARSLLLGIRWWPVDRQRDREGCAPARPAPDADVAAVAAHDVERHPQSEPGALLLLGREERLEDVRHVLVGDAVAGVPDLDVDR